MFRYLVGFGITVGLIILLVIMLFSGGDSPKKTTTAGKPLDSYASTDAEMRLTIDGPINASEDHRQIQIIVDRDHTAVNVYKGYEQEVIQTQSFANSEAGYSAFLHSLALLNFNKGESSTKAGEVGHCATGRRYVFELVDGSRTIERYWATSCNGPHTYAGNQLSTIQLFQRQIPHYDDIAIATNM